jgi:hypothetical protein
VNPNVPRLIACYFGAGAGDQWPRLARVLRHTAGRHCPGWQVQVVALPPPRGGEDPAYLANTVKLEHWYEAVKTAADGECLLLIDVDTVILRPLEDVWNRPFDLAYTIKAHAHFPFNAGVVFVRASNRVRAFLAAWCGENRRMLTDRRWHQAWRRKYGGINQAALGCVLKSPLANTLTFAQLPCPEWNCEDSSWQYFDPAVTRIVHLKSALRRTVFKIGAPAARLRPIAKIWRQLEQEAAGSP